MRASTTCRDQLRDRDRALLLDLQAARGQGGRGRRLVRPRPRHDADRGEPRAAPGGALLTRVYARRGSMRESEHLVAWCAVAPDGGADGPGRRAARSSRARPSSRCRRSAACARGCSSASGWATGTSRWRARRTAAGRCTSRRSPRCSQACGLAEERARLRARPAARSARGAHGRAPARIRHNCSGKHAFGLARCLVEGWPLDGYFRAGHPLQVAMRGCVAEACGVDDEPVEEAVDGCGMRTFAVPLAALAYAFGRLASGRLGPSGIRCADAMRAHPALGGLRRRHRHRADARRARAWWRRSAPRACSRVGLPDGRGLALKVRDGAARAVPPAAVALARSRARARRPTWRRTLVAAPIRNSRGLLVGDVVADGDAAPRAARRPRRHRTPRSRSAVACRDGGPIVELSPVRRDARPRSWRLDGSVPVLAARGLAQVVRRPRRPRGLDLERRRRRAHRRARPQRRRQVDAAAHPRRRSSTPTPATVTRRRGLVHRLPAADRRRRRARRRSPPCSPRGPSSPRSRRELAAAERAPRRPGAGRRPRRDDARARPPGAAARAAGPSSAATAPRARRAAHLRALGLDDDALALPDARAVAAASASSSRSPPASPAAPTCCCSTSPRRTSTWRRRDAARAR